MDLDPADIDRINEELQPVFRLTSILSSGWPRGCPPGMNNHIEVLNLWIQFYPYQPPNANTLQTLAIRK
jgi:hypothetical protein